MESPDYRIEEAYVPSQYCHAIFPFLGHGVVDLPENGVKGQVKH